MNQFADALPAAVVFIALVGLAFDNGGFYSGAWATAAVGLLWIAALVLLLRDDIELSALEWVWLGLLAAFLLWSTLSLAWSISHSEPLLELRRGLIYLGGAAAILFAATRRSTLDLLTGVWASISLVVAYALARYLLAPGPPDPFQENLLFRPVGYANALGILAGIAAVVGIALAAHAPSRALRAAAAASTAPFAAAVSLTSSRASALAVAAGVAGMLLLERERLRVLVLIVVAAPAVAIVVALSEHSRLSDSVRPLDAAREGRLLALWIVLAALALAAAPALSNRLSPPVPRLRSVRSARIAAIAAAVVIVLGAVAASGHAHGFFSTGARPAYWHVAWRQFSEHPALGSGAGTFADYWLRYGDPTLYAGALDAHNLYLETLSELGPLGLVLLGAALALPFVAAVRALPNPFVAGAVGGYLAFLAHAGLDWDWEMPAVTLAALACAAAVLIAGRDGHPAVRPSSTARTALLALTIGLALFALSGEIVPGLGGKFH